MSLHPTWLIAQFCSVYPCKQVNPSLSQSFEGSFNLAAVVWAQLISITLINKPQHCAARYLQGRNEKGRVCLTSVTDSYQAHGSFPLNLYWCCTKTFSLYNVNSKYKHIQVRIYWSAFFSSSLKTKIPTHFKIKSLSVSDLTVCVESHHLDSLFSSATIRVTSTAENLSV